MCYLPNLLSLYLVFLNLVSVPLWLSAHTLSGFQALFQNITLSLFPSLITLIPIIHAHYLYVSTSSLMTTLSLIFFLIDMFLCEQCPLIILPVHWLCFPTRSNLLSVVALSQTLSSFYPIVVNLHLLVNVHILSFPVLKIVCLDSTYFSIPRLPA